MIAQLEREKQVILKSEAYIFAQLEHEKQVILDSKARIAQVEHEKQVILDSEARILAQAQRERQVLLNSEARILAQALRERQVTLVRSVLESSVVNVTCSSTNDVSHVDDDADVVSIRNESEIRRDALLTSLISSNYNRGESGKKKRKVNKNLIASIHLPQNEFDALMRKQVCVNKKHRKQLNDLYQLHHAND